MFMSKFIELIHLRETTPLSSFKDSLESIFHKTNFDSFDEVPPREDSEINNVNTFLILAFYEDDSI